MRRYSRDLAIVIGGLMAMAAVAVVVLLVYSVFFKPHPREEPISGPIWPVEGAIWDASGQFAILCGTQFGWVPANEAGEEILEGLATYRVRRWDGVEERLHAERWPGDRVHLRVGVSFKELALEDCDLSQFHRYQIRR